MSDLLWDTKSALENIFQCELSTNIYYSFQKMAINIILKRETIVLGGNYF